MLNKSLNTLSLFDDERDTLRSITSSNNSSSSSTLPLQTLQFNSTFVSSISASSGANKQLSHPSILHDKQASPFKSADLAPPKLLDQNALSSSSSSKTLSFPSFSSTQLSTSSSSSSSSSSSIPLTVGLSGLPTPPAHLEFSSTLQLASSSEQQLSVCWKAVPQLLSQLELATQVQVVPSRHRTNKLKCSSSNVNFCIYFYCLPASTTLLVEFQRRSGCCILFHHILKRMFDSLSTLLPTLSMYAPNQHSAKQSSAAVSSSSSLSSPCSALPTFPSLLLPLSSLSSASSSTPSSVYQSSTPLYFQLLSQQPHLNVSSSPSLAVFS